MKKKAEGLAPGEIRAIFAHFMECGSVDAARGILFQYRDIIKDAEKKEAEMMAAAKKDADNGRRQ